jgi:peptide/nickel transport system substrate-binding protein
MGNRFGVKDFFLMVLLAVLIVSVWFSMKQGDREWTLMQSIHDQGESEGHELAQIRRLLAQGIQVTGAPATTQGSQAASMGDPFKYVKQAEAQPDYATGDWFVDNLHSKVGVLTPLVSTDLYSMYVQGRVLESLAYIDPNTLEYLPLLATSWQMSDNGMTYTFQLRRGVTFSDGEPFTADDVVFTFDWIMNPRVQAPRDRAYLEKIKSVEKQGDDQVVFHFKEPYFQSFDLASGMNILAKHFYSKYTPEQFNQNPGLLIGTGPYKLRDPAKWRPGDRIELFRNDQYWGETPSFNRIVYDQVETEAASLTMFKNGEVDTFVAQPEQYRLLLKDQNLLNRTQHFELESPLGGYLYIGWNEKRNGKPTLFTDKRVRTAMTLLTDRQRICDEVMLGYATPADGPFDPLGKPQRAPELKPLPYDPAAAKKLLKEAGFEDRNGSGVLQSPDGRPFEFKLMYPAKAETYERVVLFIKDSFAKAGIKVDLDPTDFPIMLDRLNKRDFDAASLGWSGAPEDDLYQIFHSSQIKDEGDDFISYANPELDKLIEQARSEVNEPKRMKIWQQCSRIIHEDQPYTFLYRSKSLLFMANRIEDVKPSKLGLNAVERYNMPIPWYVPKARQKYGK